MTESVIIPVHEASQTAEARRIARKMANKIGFGESRSEQVALVVTEACTNLLKHAQGGEILMREFLGDGSEPSIGLEMLALDKGPGMRNLEQCLRDGYSTGSSPGQGLGAIMRMSNVSDFYSELEKGTMILARWAGLSGSTERLEATSGSVQIGVVNVPKPGQLVCGDSWAIEQTGDQTTILVSDGLGHGIDARDASAEAVRIFHSYPSSSPQAMIERVHGGLRSTRGAAVAVARIDRGQAKVFFCGVGNISAHIYSGSSQSQHLVSVNGTAGHQMHRLHEFSYPWPTRGLLVLHSDGLNSDVGLESYPGLTVRDASLIAGILYRDFNRGYDDSTVVVAKAA